MKRLLLSTVALGLASATGAYAQISTINSAFVTHPFNDAPGATVAIANSFPTPPTISLAETNVLSNTGSANRDLWQFSANGTAPYLLQNNDYFQTTFDLTLTDNPDSPRKEAGFLLSTTSSGDIQFIVDSDAHEVVQFGGISFYSFDVSRGITYTTGDTIHLGITYFQNFDGNNAIEFWANGAMSPIFEFAPGMGIGDGSTLGGYFQIHVAPTQSEINDGMAVFQNIAIDIPEPSSLALFGLGGFALLLRRRK